MAEEILNQDQEQVEQQAPQQEEPPKKLSVGEFAAKIKSKYPEYKDIDDSELTNKMLSKFPVYKDQVDFTEKKNVGQPSRIGGQEQKTSINPPTPSQSPSSLQEGEEKSSWQTNALNPAYAAQQAQLKTGEPIPKQKDWKDIVLDKSLFNKPSASDATYVAKNVTGEKIEQVTKSRANMQTAIDNTTERALKAKGLAAPKNSPAYIKQRKKVEEAVQNGDAAYTVDPTTKLPALSQTTGFFESIKNSFISAVNDEGESDEFVNNMDTQQRVDYANKKREEAYALTKEGYVGQVPGGLKGQIGQTIGGAIPFVTKMTAGTIAGAGLVAAAPETGGASLAGIPAVLQFAFTVKDAVNQGGKNEVMRRFDILKQQKPDASDFDLMREAESGLTSGEITGGLTNLVFTAIGAKPAQAIPVIEKSLANTLKNTARGTIKSGVELGTISAGGTAVQEIEAGIEDKKFKKSAGEIIDDTVKSFGGGLTTGILLHTATQAVLGSVKLPGQLKSAIKYSLSKENPVELQAILSNNEQLGNVPQGTTEAVMADLNSYNKSLEKTSQDLTPETQASVAGLIQKRDNLMSEMSSKDATQIDPYLQQIDAINEQIKKITESNDPFAHEVNDVTGQKLDGYIPDITEQEVVKGNDKTEETVPDLTVGDLLDKTGKYKNQDGLFYLDGQTVIFKVEGKNKEYELGNINEIKDASVKDFGIEHKESVVTVGNNGELIVRGQEYKNRYSDPLMAINRDADGNVIGVTLETTNGNKRRFKGNTAEDIAYQIHLQEITKNNETRQFEEFINEPEQQQQIDNGAVPEITSERTVATDEPIQREKIEPIQQSEQATSKVTTEETDIENRRLNETGLRPLRTLDISKEQYDKDFAAWEKNKKEIDAKYDAELKALKEKQKSEVPEQTEVERLRAEEQAEYDAMPDPTDEAKRKEIYDKYDKLISPLLKEGELKAEVPKQKKKQPKGKAAKFVAENLAEPSGEGEGEPKPVEEGEPEGAVPTQTHTVETIDQVDTTGFNEVQNKNISDIKRVIQSITKLVGKELGKKLKVVIHSTRESAAKAAYDSTIKGGGTEAEARDNMQNQGNRGWWASADGEIHLNMAEVSSETTLHEGTHPILDAIAKIKPEAIDQFHKQLEALPQGKEIIELAKDNYAEYDGQGNITNPQTVKNEAITDYIAKVADGQIKIDRSNFEKVKDYVVNLLTKLGVMPEVDIRNINDLRKLAQTVSEKFAKGQEIEIKDAESYVKKAENLNTSEGIDSDLNVDDIKGESGRGIELSKKKDILDDDTIKAVKTSIINYKSIPKLKISRTLFYDNTRVGNLEIKNRNTGYAPKVVGKGGFFYSYMPESLKNKAVLAFTSVNQAIQTLKRQMLYPNSVQAIAAQNFLTAHLGNKSTLKALFGEQGSKQLGIFQDAVKKNPEGEKELLNALIESTINVANQKVQSGVNEGKPTNSSIEIKKIIDRNGGNLDNIKSLNDFRDKVLTFKGGDSFGARNILFTEMFQEKPTKITKSTRNSHQIIHYKYGIPTLSEIAEGNNQKQLNNAETGDVIKMVKPYSDPIVYTTDANIYKQYSENPTPEMVENGIKIELLPKEASHESYAFVLKGENVGILDNYIAAPQLYEQNEKIAKVAKKQSFYNVGRMPSDAAPGEYPSEPISQGTPQFSKTKLPQQTEEVKGTLDGKPVTFVKEPENVEVVNGFYSPIEKRLTETKIDKQSANKWREIVGKGDEAKFTGVLGWLESLPPTQQVSKSEIQKWMKDNRIEINEVVKGKQSKNYKLKSNPPEDLGINRNDALDILGKAEDLNNPGLPEFMERRYGKSGEDILNWLKENTEEIGTYSKDTKYETYQLPGEKTNYKEVLVTLPFKKSTKLPEGYTSEMSPDGKYRVYDEEQSLIGEGKTEQEAIADALNEPETAEKPVFKSSHYDEPNILAHIRMNTRVDAEGNKVLHIEEFQSDFGQKAKKEGFLLPEKEKNKLINELEGNKQRSLDIIVEMKDAFNKEDINKVKELSVEDSNLNKRNSEINDLVYKNKGVPEAPFVSKTSDWTKLAWKVALKEAVKEGADKITWTTGEQQNDRYDLSKSVDEITYSKSKDGKYQFSGSKNEVQTFNYREIPENKLEDYVGKEVAQKIINNEGELLSYGNKEEGTYNELGRILSGVDLKVGGTGMKGFYGSPSESKLGIVGEVAKSLFKQEPSTTEINQSPDFVKQKLTVVNEPNEPMGRVWLVVSNEGDVRGRFSSKEEATQEKMRMQKQREDAIKTSTQHSIDITPEMKAQVESGMPMFSKTKDKKMSDMKDILKEYVDEGKSLDEIKDILKDEFGDYYKDVEKIIIQAHQEMTTTGIKNEVTERERAERGLAEVEVEAKRSFGKVFDTANEMINNKDINGLTLAAEIVKNPRPLKAEESAVLLIDRMRISKEYGKRNAELLEAQKNGETDKADIIQSQMESLEEEMDLNDEAARKSGYEQGLGLAARRMLIAQDYSLVTQMNRLKAANAGKEVPKQYQEQLKTLITQLEEANNKLEKLEKTQAGTEKQKEVSKVKPVSRTTEQVAKEKQNIKSKIVAKWGQTLARMKAATSIKRSVSPTPVTPQKQAQLESIVKDVNDMIKLYAESGVTDLKKIINDVHQDLVGSLPGLDRVDIEDIVLGRYDTQKPKTPLTPAKMQAQANVRKVKTQIDLLKEELKNKQRSGTEKSVDYLHGWHRFSILSGIPSVGKIGMAAVTRGIVTRAENLVGQALSLIPGIRQITKKAPRHGGISARAEAKAFSNFFNKMTRQDVMETMKTGVSQIDYLYGKKELMAGKVPEWMEFFGRMHSAIKLLPKRAEFFRSLEMRTEYALKNGKDINDPMVQQEMATAAYNDALRAIFMQDNIVTDAYSNVVKKLGDKYPALASGLKFALPIVKVPTNYVAEAAEYMPIISGLNALSTIIKGRKGMTEEQSDFFTRQLKKGAIGTAIIFLGFTNPQAIGGYYTGKRKKDDLEAGDIELFGVKLPHFMLHTPLLEMLQIGATMRRAQDAKAAKGEESSLFEGVPASFKGLGQQVPFIGTGERLSRALEKEEPRNEYLYSLGKSLLEPQLMQNLADWTDTQDGKVVKRKTGDFSESLKEGIPKLRGTLKEDKTKFTDKEYEEFSNITEKGVNIPELNKRTTYKVKIDTEHPDGHMTEDEYDKFIPIQKEYVKNAYKKFYSIHKSDFDRLQKIIDAVPETPEEKAKMNALKNAIQNKIDAVHNEAIKAAKRKIGLTQK